MELIVVLLIVAIMAAVAAPSLSNLDSTRSSMAGKQILRDVTFARQRALATGTVSWVVFSTSAGTWSVLAENPASPGRDGASAINDLATGRSYITTLGVNEFVGVSIASCNFGGGNEIGFNWLGKPIIPSGAALANRGSVVLSSGNRVNVEVTGCIRYLPLADGS